MGYKDIKAGEKVGKPIAARFVKPKEHLGLEVSFEFEESSGSRERLTWTGWLSEAAIENTMDCLVGVLGFNGNDDCDDNGILTDSNALAYGRQVKLIVELDEYNGKHYPKIKFVNRMGLASAGAHVVKNKSVVLKAAFERAKVRLSQVQSATELPMQIPF